MSLYLSLAPKRFAPGAHSRRGTLVVSTLLILLAACGVAAGYAVAASVPASVPATVPATAPAPDPMTTALDPYRVKFEKIPAVAAMSALGKQLFSDPTLSASSHLSCAGCHDPARAYGPPNGQAVQHGGASEAMEGVRAVPSLRYRQNVPAFTEHFHEGEDEKGDQGPTGGYTWDGRAATLHDQARLPLFSPLEMANSSTSAVVAKVRQAPYAQGFKDTFGAHVLDDENRAFAAIILSLEVFQQDAKEFYPYSSKYDAYLAGRATLTREELRGLALFNDPDKGNCAVCHPSTRLEGAAPSFSDYGYVAVGVPRNTTLASNRDARFYDLGLCGPYRTDLQQHTEYCGMFRTPSLRNVALRQSFFHNGEFHDLRRVVQFYVERDNHPERWYPHGVAFDDLPAAMRANVNTEIPFGQKRGEPDRLSGADMNALVAFMKTLTDGYRANAVRPEPAPAARPPA